ncbi:uncharacterized protein [Erythrolamprus reginae]|uniref:uncharacterized protein n=1 Tax=Erythrolamprus reginae TaxID=121349 RepID=UPI00396CBC32
MAENQQLFNGDAPERRLALMPSAASSTSGASELHPNSLGHVTSSSTLSSLTVPVRLDVLYFLLNSAAKGAQMAPLPTQSGQGSVSTCHGPGALQAGSCCTGCHPTCHKASGGAPYALHPSTPPRDETVYRSFHSPGRLSGGIPDRQNNQPVRVAQWDDGKNWSGSPRADPARGWKRSQSPLRWKERDEGGRYWKGDQWQGKEGNFRKSWTNQRETLAESTPWSSGFPNRKREGVSPFRDYSLNVKQKQEGTCWQERRDAPKGQRYSTRAQVDWPRKQGPQESASFVDKAAAVEMTPSTGQDKSEDWEAEYESTQETASVPESFSNPSLPNKVMKTCEAGGNGELEWVPTTDLPKQILETSPLPKPLGQDQEATSTEMEATSSVSNWRKDGRFGHYLQSLYSDVLEKSSSGSSTDLTIDTDPEKSKPEEEEAMKSASDGESKPLE